MAKATLSTVLKQLGSRIKELRKGRRLSQEALAHRAGISRTYIGTIELGTKQATLATLVRISNALNLDLVELFLATKRAPVSLRATLARIQSKLLAKGRSTEKLRKIEDLIDAFFGDSL